MSRQNHRDHKYTNEKELFHWVEKFWIFVDTSISWWNVRTTFHVYFRFIFHIIPDGQIYAIKRLNIFTQSGIRFALVSSISFEYENKQCNGKNFFPRKRLKRMSLHDIFFSFSWNWAKYCLTVRNWFEFRISRTWVQHIELALIFDDSNLLRKLISWWISSYLCNFYNNNKKQQQFLTNTHTQTQKKIQYKNETI